MKTLLIYILGLVICLAIVQVMRIETKRVFRFIELPNSISIQPEDLLYPEVKTQVSGESAKLKV